MSGKDYLKFNNPNYYLTNYLAVAPLALAFERYLECKILSRYEFRRPVLDVGCGEGLFANILFKNKIDTGIDPNKKELLRAKSLDSYEELIQCYGDNIPKVDNYFNTIFSNSVCEHIADLENVLKEAFRVLKPGGVMYITVPTDLFDKYSFVNQILRFLSLEKISKKYSRFYNKFWKHYHYYDESTWHSLLKKNGFIVEQSHTYASPFSCVLNDILVPFAIMEVLTKKLLNRWTLLPRFRRIFLYPLSRIMSSILEDSIKCKKGGLIFLMVRKPL